MKIQGVPDTPYSLMEGQAGHIACLADFLGWENTPYKNVEINFPGYEL